MKNEKDILDHFLNNCPVEAKNYFENILSSGLALDGVLAENKGQQNDLWALRENIPEANRRIGAVSSHDISLPLSKISNFIEEARVEISKLGNFRINCFGHLGDGNLHFNIFPNKGEKREEHDDVRPTIKTAIHDLVHLHGGSVSAEHGIGRLKINDLVKYSDPIKLKLNKSIKSVMDPNGILIPKLAAVGSSTSAISSTDISPQRLTNHSL